MDFGVDLDRAFARKFENNFSLPGPAVFSFVSKIQAGPSASGGMRSINVVRIKLLYMLSLTLFIVVFVLYTRLWSQVT